MSVLKDTFKEVTNSKVSHTLIERSERRSIVNEDTYSEPTVIQVNHIRVTVHSPVLTDEERNKRINTIKAAVSRLFANK